MHPDIKKFWEDEGFIVKALKSNLHLDCFIYNAPYRIWPLAIIYTTNKSRNRYWLGDKALDNYSEEEMLRIIKLKAFL